MTERKEKMILELKKCVIPELRGLGFKGSFPHFRRINPGKVDLLTFQFNNNGGSFLVEISVVFPDEVGKGKNLCSDQFASLPIEKLEVGCTNIRKRLWSKRFNDVWFHYWNLAEVRSFPFRKLIIDVNPKHKEDFIKGHKGKIKWIQIVDDSIYETCAREVKDCLNEAEIWWRTNPKKK